MAGAEVDGRPSYAFHAAVGFLAGAALTLGLVVAGLVAIERRDIRPA